MRQSCMAGNAASGRRAGIFTLAFCVSGLGLTEATHLRRTARSARIEFPTKALEDDVQAVEDLAAELRAKVTEDSASPISIVRDEGVLSGVGGPIVGDNLDKMKKGWKKAQETGRKQLAKTKPLLNKINVMRADMCWERPSLWSHEKCVKFLGIMCSKGSTGKGVCGQFIKTVQEHCDTPDNKIEEKMCAFFKSIDIPIEPEEKKSEEVVDKDGDGYTGKEDIFPEDSEEWADLDKDGIGDNEDDDVQVSGKVKSSRKKGTRIKGSSKGSSSTKNATGSGKDTDGDGVLDSEDAFPENAKEWGDLDGDGLGDQIDKDIDGDGALNDDDKAARDPKVGGFKDTDGDGVADQDDAFPEDPKESSDKDGDGVGDNADAFPENPNCNKAPCTGGVADGAGGAGGAGDFNHKWKHGKAERGLPPDGYDEYTPGKVEHNDMETGTTDWRKEYPQHHDSHKGAMETICAENPDSEWCKQNGYHAA